MAIGNIEKSFTAAASSDPLSTDGPFNISLDYTTGAGAGTVGLYRSFDSGVTWHLVEEFTGNTQKIADSPERILHKLECTVFTSGSIAGRLSYSNNR